MPMPSGQRSAAKRSEAAPMFHPVNVYKSPGRQVGTGILQVQCIGI